MKAKCNDETHTCGVKVYLVWETVSWLHCSHYELNSVSTLPHTHTQVRYSKWATTVITVGCKHCRSHSSQMSCNKSSSTNTFSSSARFQVRFWRRYRLILYDSRFLRHTSSPQNTQRKFLGCWSGEASVWNHLQRLVMPTSDTIMWPSHVVCG